VLHLAPQHENIWWAGSMIPCIFNPGRKRETGPSTDWPGGWVGQRGSLEAIEKRKFFPPCPESNTHSSINQPFTLLLL